jgi:hypothetical protein
LFGSGAEGKGFGDDDPDERSPGAISSVRPLVAMKCCGQADERVGIL